ncbi:MAG: tRNA dimethylallyltransferase [Chlamydiia bacterium]|nr:tRNA dimethylallyltransferase [Chlamydiia bacterium]
MGRDTYKELEPQLQESESLKNKKKKIIILAGPTSTGKTDLSLIIGKAIGGEIISADSVQLYKGTDIGSAKATKEQRKTLPHHLLDICDIKDYFSVVNFHDEVVSSCEEIFNHNSTPIIVGGAGFYIHTILFGPPKGPPADPTLRKSLEEDAEKYGIEMLHGKLKSLDPDYAETITLSDKHKIIRALEIMALTGKKVTEIPKPSREDIPKDIDFRCWFLYYPKDILYKRIERRCEAMVENGLVDEVLRLKEEGLLENPSAANAIGYRQVLNYLETRQTDSDWEVFLQNFKKASRNYAKRQFTWFRKEPLFRWLDLSKFDTDRACEIIISDFENN